MHIQGVILDVDGTLVLSNDAHAQAWVDAFAEHGYTVPFERVRGLIGMGGDKLMPEVVPGLNDEQAPGKAIAERRKQIFSSRYASGLQPTPGARDLLLHLQREGLRLIIASSAQAEELELLLAAAQVDDISGLLEEATTSSDAEESKPAPDIVAVALDRLKLPPDQVVMLGDTPYDLRAASGCGVGLIGVRTGGFADEQLAGARAIYDDPADLLAHYADSPLVEAQQVK